MENENGSRKPVRIVLSHHDRNNRRGMLDPFASSIDSMAKTSSDRRVAVFAENANGSIKEANRIRRFMQNGGVPTQANLDFLAWFKRKPTKPESFLMNALYKGLFPKDSSFHAYMMQLVANASKNHPGKIDFVPEGHSEEDRNGFTKGKNKFFLSLIHSSVYTHSGKFSKALPHFKNAVNFLASNVRRRDKNITQQLDNVLSEDQTFGLVGEIGAIHTLFTHMVDKKGHKVTRIFPEKEEGNYIYLPIHELTRRLIFHPDKPLSDNDWRIGLVRNLIANHALNLNKEATQQSILKKVWKATKHINIDEVNDLEVSIRSKGSNQALNEYLTQHID